MTNLYGYYQKNNGKIFPQSLQKDPFRKNPYNSCLLGISSVPLDELCFHRNIDSTFNITDFLHKRKGLIEVKILTLDEFGNQFPDDITEANKKIDIGFNLKIVPQIKRVFDLDKDYKNVINYYS